MLLLSFLFFSESASLFISLGINNEKGLRQVLYYILSGPADEIASGMSPRPLHQILILPSSGWVGTNFIIRGLSI